MFTETIEHHQLQGKGQYLTHAYEAYAHMLSYQVKQQIKHKYCSLDYYIKNIFNCRRPLFI